MILPGCGHNAHLEDPEKLAAKLRLWLLEIEEQARIHFLGREEARRSLSVWASEFAWQTASKTHSDWRRRIRRGELPQEDQGATPGGPAPRRVGLGPSGGAERREHGEHPACASEPRGG